MLHHVLLEVDDLERSASFYDSMLAPLGWRRHFDEDETIGWGIAKPVFFISAHHDPQPGLRTAQRLRPRDRRRQGGLGERDQSGRHRASAEPGERRSYGSGSYSAFLKDPDGYEIEITDRVRLSAPLGETESIAESLGSARPNEFREAMTSWQ